MSPDPQQSLVGRARVALTERHHARMVAVADLVAIGAALLLGVLLGWGYEGPISDPPRTFMIVTLAVLWPTMLWQTQTRATTILGGGAEEYRRVLLASLWTVALTMSLAYITNTQYGRRYLVYVAITGTVFLLVERAIMRNLLHRRLQRGEPLHRVFVVAAEAQYEQLAKQFARSGGLMDQVGSWDLTDAADPDPAVVVKAAVDCDADTIVYAPAQHEDPSWPRRLGWAMEESDLSLLVSPQIANIAGPRLSIEPINGMALVRVEMPRFSGPARFIKRTIDIVGSSLLLIVLALPLAVVALVIKATSKGPVFFMQTRAGVGGSTFECFKFRTMVADADAQRDELRASHGDDGATFKMARDPRITGVGHFLRRFSLDELPQLFNVWLGQMSLIGPRPHPLDDVERYDDVATRRLLAKPGMTGLWQVSGRSDLDWEQSVMLDLYYVENWSLPLDAIIVLRTMKAVLTGRGAY
ncbi:MAG: sugar transferase [Actinobacteria bacterium]|nr:MAG: sugar transferase [Actinomycetota bacterium]